MNLKKALPTITVILAVTAPGFLAVSAAIDNVSLNARSWYVESNVHYIFHVDYSGSTYHFSRSLPKLAH
jgi:hypothetical protein